MAKRKSNKPKAITDIVVAHAHEQCEAVSSQFADMMCHYGMEGCIYVKDPNGDKHIFCFSNNNSMKNSALILKECYELTADFGKHKP